MINYLSEREFMSIVSRKKKTIKLFNTLVLIDVNVNVHCSLM